MKMSTFFRFAISVVGVAALLAGCSGGTSSSGVASGLAPGGINPAAAVGPRGLNPGGPFPPIVLTPLSAAAVRAKFHPHRRWAAPDIARSPRLLFVSDSTPAVNIYSMPSLARMGQVTGFTEPLGLCNDTSGNIWVTDFSAQTITEVSRAGVAGRSLADRDGYPYSCAVDPSTGNLAVTNLFTTSGAGNVSIYLNAHGDGEPITNPAVELMYYAGYDTSGDLWVDGQDPSGEFVLSSCTTSACTTIPISGGTIYFPGFIQWVVGPGHGGSSGWYIADRECGDAIAVCIYPISGSGALGAAITLTDPQGNPVCGLFEGAITNHMSRVLVGGVDDSACSGINSVARWGFPTGGSTTHGNNDVMYPFGAAISSK
jgi:hypothetical protein